MKIPRIEALARTSSRVRELGSQGVVLLLPLIFNPYSSQSFEAPKVLFFRWSVAALALASLIERAGDGRSRAWTCLDLSALGYASIYALAAVLSVAPALSFWGSHDGHGTLTLLCMVAFYFIVSGARRTRDETSRLITSALLGTVPVAVYGIAQFLGLDPLHWITDSVSPVLSTMGRSNFLGAYMAMVMPLTLLRIATTKGRSLAEGSWRVWTVLLLQIALVVLSQARAAWLSAVAGIVVFTALWNSGERRRSYLRLSIILLSLGALLYLPLSRVDLPFPGEGGAGPSEPSFAELRAHTVASRIAIWRCTLSLVSERPLLGYGPETFSVEFASRCPIAPPGWIVDDPHNLFLEQLFAAGALGAAAFAVLLASFLWTAIRSRKRALDRYGKTLWAGLIASEVAFLVQGQFNPDVIVLSVLFWLLLAISRAATFGTEENGLSGRFSAREGVSSDGELTLCASRQRFRSTPSTGWPCSNDSDGASAASCSEVASKP